jgi:hypothetical protein
MEALSIQHEALANNWQKTFGTGLDVFVQKTKMGNPRLHCGHICHSD